MSLWSDTSNYNVDTRTGDIGIQYPGTYFSYGQICFEEEKKQLYLLEIRLNNNQDDPLAECRQGFSDPSKKTESTIERMLCCTFSFGFICPGNAILSVHYSIGGDELSPRFYVTSSTAFLGFIKLQD